MSTAYENILNTLTKGGFNPDFQFMDNKLLIAMKEKMINLGINFDLTPPGNHQANNF